MKPISAGEPLPGLDVRLEEDVTESGAEQADLPAGAGEIQVKGPNVFAGYRNLPDKTDDAFTDDGYYRTGDLGRLDDDGDLCILGRLSTMIVSSGGENIQPTDVESAYAKHPAIEEVGVLEVEGQLAAVVVPTSEYADDPQAVQQALDERSADLPTYQRIGEFQISRRALPRTRLGKIRRHLLEERYETLREGESPEEERHDGPVPIEEWSTDDRAILEDAGASDAWEWLAKEYSDHPLEPDTHLQRDLGVDSMQWLDVTMQISRHAGVELDEEAIGRIQTVRDLLEEVSEATGEGEAVSFDELLSDPESHLDAQQMRWLRPHGSIQSVASSAGYLLNRGLMKGIFRVKGRHIDRLPDDGPFIIAPTHRSHLDPFAIAAVLPMSRLKRTWWAGWVGVAFSNRFARLASRLSHIVPIDEERHVRSSLAYGAAIMKRGDALVWFPEGRRSPDGSMQPFKQGVGLLADHFDVPIVPAHIQGAYDAWPVGRRAPRPQRLSVYFDHPVQATQLEQDGAGETRAQRIVDALRNRSLRLVQVSEQA